MEKVRNDAAGFVVTGLIEVINANRAYIAESVGAIGDGDHGINMSKGFSAAGDRVRSQPAGLSRALAVLGETLINGVGGSMGPLYGTFFGAMSEVLGDREFLDAPIFSAMLTAGLKAIQEIGEAQEGDNTLHDALVPARAAFDAALAAGGRFQRAILMCGTGIGMSICANKVPGVRAAQAHDTYSAERARKSNDAQVLAMGARVVGPELAKSIVKAWLESEFEPARSAPKVKRIEDYEARRR